MEIIKAKDFGIAEDKGKSIKDALQTTLSERELLIEEFKTVSRLEVTRENLSVFRELRLKISNNRTKGINKWHKANKQYFLSGGKFVDAIKNVESLVNTTMEEKLLEGEKHFELVEKKRLEDLQASRFEELKPYCPDAEERVLFAMEDDVWIAFFNTKKKAHEDKIIADQKEADEKEELRKAAKKERLEKEKKQRDAAKKLKDENKRLKEEADAKQKTIDDAVEELNKAQELQDKRSKELQPYIVFIRDYNGLISKPESEYQKELEDIKKGAQQQWDFERKQEEKRKKEAAEKQAKIDAALAEVKKAQKEIADKKAGEERAIEAAEKAKQEHRQLELNKGDEDKLNDLLFDLHNLKTKYTFRSEKNKIMYNNTSILIDKVINFINK